MEPLPSISVIIPTLNAASVLRLCLDSIASQDYPREKVEIVVADGGSKDSTLDIAHEFGCIIVPNPLVTAEGGKAVGVKSAKNDILAFIDSDNILPDRDWMRRMVEPFSDPRVIGSEPLYYTYRKQDPYITRYCALLGMNDPICLFLGNYDRYSYITNKWTGLNIKQEDRGNYILLELEEKALPTIGANGFMVRRDALLETSVGDYLFDIDAIYELVTRGKDRFAKVKVGIVHLYSKTASNFMRKQRRRIRDYAYYQKLNIRKYPWSSLNERLLYFVLSTVFIVPLLVQMTIGYSRKRDRAWLFHLPACWITLLVYVLGTVQNKLSPGIEDRSGWKQ
jgi:glycosyltransferase involved in cell wall biosynthesis